MTSDCEQLIVDLVNEVVEMEATEEEVDLCVVCCSKVKKDLLNNINSKLLSRNLIAFYLVRNVLKVSDNELRKNLINCGSPVEWIKLCDKCGELTKQAEELYRNLRRIERELKCVEKLIRDKTSSSINSEHDRKVVEETIDLTKNSGQVWRRIRNHVANKCNSSKSRSASAELFTDPFSEGDKLANYLLSQNVFTAIIPNEHSKQNEENDDDHVDILEEANAEATSSSSASVEIKVEPQLLEIVEDSPNYDNLLIDSLLEEFKEEIVESNDQDDKNAYLDGADKPMEEDDKLDWNWEPVDKIDNEDEDEVDEGSFEVEEDDDHDNPEENNSLTIDDEDDLKDKGPETGASSSRACSASIPKRKKVNKLHKVKDKGPKRSKYIKKGTQKRLLRTEDGRVKCRQCGQIFASPSGLNSHEREKHSKTPGAFICDLCPSVFNSRDYLRKHVKRHHELNPDGTPKIRLPKMTRNVDGKYQCRHCDQSFSSSSGCSTHENEKHSKTPGAFVCDLCGRAFNSASYLKSHMSCSHKLKADGTPIPKKPPKLEKDHMCDLCGKGFKTAKQLRRHTQFVHEKRFNINCSLCDMGFPSTNSLRKHQLAIHTEDPSVKKLIEQEGLGLWKCPVVACTARFLKESCLKGHLRKFHGRHEERVEGLNVGAGVLQDPDLKVACPICGKVYPSKQSLRNHEKVHENKGKPRDFICEICGGGFVSREYLKMHVDKVHLKKGVPKGKDFKCEICGKAYAHKYMLKGHMEIHEREGKRDYFCEKCGHDFVTEGHLKQHKKVTNCGVEGKKARVYQRKGE